MSRVLIVEDEAPQREVLRLYLERENLEVEEADSGPLGWEKFQETRPDLVLLDLMLPGFSGEELCRRIREVSEEPILVMTAKVQEENALRVFRLGADDFLRKPVSPREVTARVKRRLAALDQGKILSSRVIPLRLNLEEMSAFLGPQPLDLTPQEFDILVVFLTRKNQVLTREQVIQTAWPHSFEGNPRTVDVHIKNLRRKLPTPNGNSPICTIYGRGYRWLEH